MTVVTGRDTQESLGRVVARVGMSDGDTRAIAYSVRTGVAASGGQIGPTARGLSASGTYALGDTPRVSLDAEGVTTTALIDALANARGWLREGLGSSVSLDASATGVALDGSSGSFTALLRSERADAALSGALAGGALVLGSSGAPTSIELSEISPRWGLLAGLVLGGDPGAFFDDSVEKAGNQFIGIGMKQAGDQPLVIQVPLDSEMVVPLDGDMAKLNGSLIIDVGSVTFEAGTVLAGVLDGIQGNTTGTDIRPLTPIRMDARDGVLSVSEVEMRVGDVTFGSRGSFDFVRGRYERVLTVAPSRLGGDLGRAVERVPGLRNAIRVPLRQRGRFGQPAQWELALDLVGEELLKPENVGGLIDDVLGDLFGGGKKDDDEDK